MENHLHCKKHILIDIIYNNTKERMRREKEREKGRERDKERKGVMKIKAFVRIIADKFMNNSSNILASSLSPVESHARAA